MCGYLVFLATFTDEAVPSLIYVLGIIANRHLFNKEIEMQEK